MGCWNGTCGISQLPIFDGEEVVAILIEKFSNAGKLTASCGCTDRYTPVSFPIIGKYDDYGCIKNFERLENEFALRHLEIIREQKWKKLNFQDVFDCAGCGNFSKIHTKIGLILIKKSVYAPLLAASFHEIWNRAQNCRPKDLYFQAFVLRNSAAYLTDDDISTLFGSNMSGFSVKCAELITLKLVMNRLRKELTPGCGAGSQTGITEIHSIFADCYKNEIKANQDS